jgi:hypothetical protein
MPEIAGAKTETQSPQAQLIQMATAHWVSRLLYVAAQMNLADRLAEGPMTAEELAPSTATDAPSISVNRIKRSPPTGVCFAGPSTRSTKAINRQ